MKLLFAVWALASFAFAPIALAGHSKKGGGGGGRAGKGGGAMHQGGGGHALRQGKGARLGRAGRIGRKPFGVHNAAFNRHLGLHNHLHRAFRARAFRVQKYSVVFRNYHRVFHDRFWWHSHYNHILFIGGGWYYWDAGYWYPAWGYDPAITFYAYDGPVYSYDNLPPNQVILNVQTELQFQGYYAGPVDGQLGPQTRDAIGDYQRDHFLEVTQAVDEDTVNSLGLS